MKNNPQLCWLECFHFKQTAPNLKENYIIFTETLTFMFGKEKKVLFLTIESLVYLASAYKEKQSWVLENRVLNLFRLHQCFLVFKSFNSLYFVQEGRSGLFHLLMYSYD